jgi:TonB family protein
MKRIPLLSCMLLLVAIDALAQSGGMAPPPAEWQRYKVNSEEFSIALPTLPAMTTFRQSRNAFVTKERTQRDLGVYADGVVYTIFSDDDDPQSRLKNSVKQAITAQGWDPATEQTVTCGDFTGKQYTSTHALGGVVQLFATKKHFYRIQAFGATAADPRVQHFFSSLTLGKKTDGIEVTDGPGTPLEPIDGSISIPEENVFTGKQVDRKVIVLQKPEPSYTESARLNHVTGTVVLKVIFSANGSILNVRVVSDLPYGLTRQAIAAAQKIKFIPAAKDGKFVPVWMQLEYNFNLY